jgi:hypothetical protein
LRARREGVVLHHGAFIFQSVAGHQELLGPEVTISHLLLKNHVADLIGRKAYALVTEPAAAHLEIPLERALPITEQYALGRALCRLRWFPGRRSSSSACARGAA